ncbi:LysR family transcriptional regulator [Caballeronia sp. SBC2]|uniref:LysR family transcriptional regulator n=1 Tax=Caballeronia sp. SBC2 TaxID=2705547 RepID=UPI0013E1BE04|nr:LysR family transcriptional regulator [Caballeronia sp. SBC2]QIE30471.1 HTH-type transcriptional regulator HdfR [Caballeronia sp. SBC2]
MYRDPSVHLKNPTALRYFYEVAKAGSFRRAAEQIHVAASAINRQVKNLEEEIGAQLFERGPGRSGIKLTAAGEILLHRVRLAMSELSAAWAEVDALQGLQRGTVNFGVNESASTEFIPRLLTAFHKTYPGVNFEVTVASSLRLVELTLDDEIDFAVAFNPPISERLEILTKLELGTCIMVDRKHPLAARARVTLSDCVAYNFVMPDNTLAMRTTLDQMFDRIGARPRPVLTTNSYELMRAAAAAGIGIAVVARCLFGINPSYPDAVFIPVSDPWVKSQMLVCCTRAERHLAIASHSLIEQIKDVLRQLV